jgi:hypothetical protein
MDSKSRFTHSLLCALLVLTGCASSRQLVPFPDQNATDVQAGMARIYAIHTDGKGPFPVVDGTKLIGEISGGCYVCWEREPGTATIITGQRIVKKSDASYGTWERMGYLDASVSLSILGKPHNVLVPVSHNFTFEAGKTYYIVLEKKTMPEKVKVQLTDEKTGSTLLLRNKRASVRIPRTD